MKRIIAFDPSMTHMGFCVMRVYDNDDIFIEELETFNFDDKISIKHFLSIMEYYIKDFTMNITAIAYENNPFGNKLIQLGQRRAIGFIQGVACAYRLDIPIVGIHSSHVKAVFGNGRATKEETIAKVKARFGIECDEHQADSVSVAYCYYQDYKEKERIKQIKKQQKKLRGVK